MTTKFAPEAPANCPLCPRLVAYREEVAVKEPDWFNGAVPSFGPEDAELLIIGLAPGVTGANRTGRPFTGDWAGDLLYATIDKFGFSTGTYDARPDDGLKLKRAMITNAVRCVPPQNKPVGTLGLKLKDYPFGHGTHYDVEFEGRPLALISSYHCSRYNTNTRRLTPEMFEDVFAMAKKVTDSD